MENRENARDFLLFSPRIYWTKISVTALARSEPAAEATAIHQRIR